MFGPPIYLGHLGRVPVYVNVFALFSLWFIWQYWSDRTVPGFLIGVMAYLTQLLIHEGAHAVMAQLTGMQGVTIVIDALGGFCSYLQRGYRAVPQILISLAGPLANLATYAVLWVLLRHGPDLMYQEQVRDFAKALADMSLVFGLFNLLPIYPLDGGQVSLALSYLVSRSEANARRFTLSLSVTAALATLLGLHLLGFQVNTFTIMVLVFLLFSAFRDLR